MIGKILKHMRIQNKLKQKELAKLTNIKQNTLSQYETESRQITFSNIEMIANKCGYKIYFENENDRFESKEI